MGVTVTTAGGSHYSNVVAGTTPSTLFGRIILDKGNVVPDPADTTAVLVNQIITQAAEVPTGTLGDSDPRNGGSGSLILTWKFRIPPMSTPAVASNVAMGGTTNSGNETTLAIHADEVIWTEPYRDTLVWLNIGSGLVGSFYTAFEENPVEAARLRASGPTADIVHGGPGSVIMRPNYVYTTVSAGEPVPIRGRLYGHDEIELRVADVKAVTVDIYRRDNAIGTWAKVARRALDRCLIEIESQTLSAKFPYRGGYNFENVMSGTHTRDGLSRKFVYEFVLCDGSRKKITQEVRVSG